MSPCRLSDHPDALAGEVRISWAADAHPETVGPYLREGVVPLAHRSRRPGRRHVPGRLVAWAELRPSARSSSIDRHFRRRVWWLAEHDPYLDGGCPAEAVDPCSIRPGHESRPPRRSA